MEASTKEEVSIHVHEVRQTSSGGSYVVIFDAHILILPNDSSIKARLVDSTVNLSLEDDLRARAVECIQEGVESVLCPRGMGAVVEISNLHVHILDFRDERFTEFAATHLEAALLTEGGIAC